jgi:membrane protein implicated in regulation of membrane protease activity
VYQAILSPWFWLGLTVIFTLIELGTFHLVTIWFAFAAAAMIFVSGFTGHWEDALRFKLYIGMFLFTAAALLVFSRPFALKKLKLKRYKTNVDDLIGRAALVTKKITRYEKGEAKVKGQLWTAVSCDDEDIEEKSDCEVVRIEGVKLVLRKR